MIKLGQMVLKGVNWLHNDKNRSNGLERSQLVRQYKSCHMVLKGVNWVHNDNTGSILKSGQLGTQYKYQLKWS